MSNTCDERKEIFDAYIELADKVKGCRIIVNDEVTLLSEDDIEEWNKMSLCVIGDLACLRIKTKALLQKRDRVEDHKG